MSTVDNRDRARPAVVITVYATRRDTPHNAAPLGHGDRCIAHDHGRAGVVGDPLHRFVHGRGECRPGDSGRVSPRWTKWTRATRAGWTRPQCDEGGVGDGGGAAGVGVAGVRMDGGRHPRGPDGSGAGGARAR